jgi:hypothetical protein
MFKETGLAGGESQMFQAREGQLLKGWMTARAEAERFRSQYFEKITTLPLTGDGITPLLLQIEYFRRYQLDVQLTYYAKRSADHRRSAALWLKVSSAAVVLGSVSAGLAGVLSTVNPAWISIAALGTIATALAALASTEEAVGQNRAKTERFEGTRSALALLKGKLDDVRKAAAENRAEPVEAFVAAVHQLMDAEHQQWLGAEKSIESALEKLKASLDDVDQSRKEALARTALAGKRE